MSVQNMQNHMDYEHIPAEKFAFTQLDTNIHDKKTGNEVPRLSGGRVPAL